MEITHKKISDIFGASRHYRVNKDEIPNIKHTVRLKDEIPNI